MAGVNHHQSVEQASSSGPIWQKVDVTTEKHKIHVNPHFGGAVHIHSPSVIVERVNGSGLFPNLHSDSQVQYRSVTDEHERTSKSQKSLTAGAALIVKLAATLAMTTLTGNPLAAEGLMGSVMSAGLNTLCSDAAVCLVQNDGDPARAMEAMGERNIGKSMFISMAGAGLTGALGVSGSIDATGLSTSELIKAYAKQELIRASVNATLAATIDGQDLGQAMLQGIITAGISTAAAFGAHKIGDLHKPSGSGGGASSTATVEPISGATHKLLHTALGAGLGATTAAITGDDIAKGAASGGFGALVGTLMTEAMVDDKTPTATAQRITQMSDLITTTLALAAGLDPVSAYAASRNANEHNKLQHLDTLKALGIVKEGEEVYEGDEPEKTEGQKQYEKGLRKYVKDEAERVRQIRRTALTQDDYEHIEKQATKYYAQAYWAQQAPGLTVEYGLTATSLCTGGVTGAVLGAADTAYGIVTGKTKAPTTTAELFDTATSMLPGTKLTTLLKGASKFDRAVTHLSSSSTAKQMPVCMTRSHNPKADVFKRVARDDWYVHQSQTGSRFLEFDTRAMGLERAGQQQTATLELSYNVGSRQAFDRKLTALQDLAERGKLHKASSVVRDKAVTDIYRKNILAQAELQWGSTDPARVARIEKALKYHLHADHMHELQLAGTDHLSALALIDKQVNTSVGAQIMHQIKDLPAGTKITQIVEKGAVK